MVDSRIGIKPEKVDSRIGIKPEKVDSRIGIKPEKVDTRIKIYEMTRRISKSKRFVMMNPIIQFFKFIYLSLKILVIVAGGHGGTRKVDQ